jgi:hypothetical protein
VKRPWMGWTVRGTVALALLAGVAHARHQTIPQMAGDAFGAAAALTEAAGSMVDQAGTGSAHPELTLNPVKGRMPARITVTGTGYQPHEKVEITAHIAVLATASADAHGAFTTKIRVPAGTFCPDGQCTITAQGKNSIKWTTAPYDVTG